MTTTQKRLVAGIERALTVLVKLGESPDALGVSELSRSVDLPKASVFRILKTLEKHGFVRASGKDQKYALGLRLLELGERVRAGVTTAELARPVLDDLAARAGETVAVAVADGRRALIVSAVKGRRWPLLTVNPGPVVPLHCSAVGKVLLSGLSDEELHEYVSSEHLERYTEKTITDPDALLQEIGKVRLRGYAYNEEESERGLVCVAAPIYGVGGDVAAALAISGPASRLSGRDLENARDLVLVGAARISERMGLVPPCGKSGRDRPCAGIAGERP